MIGLVLAAGTGRRLRPAVGDLPKTLAPLRRGDHEATPLEVILANFAAVGLARVVVVVGYAAAAIRVRREELSERFGVELELVENDRAQEWNNCYSLWCAREFFAAGCLLANGDTVHPVSVEQVLLSADQGPVTLAVDTRKPLAAEEMKIRWSATGGVAHISKAMDPAVAYGEYIGVARIDAAAAAPLTDALATTWQRDPQLYYEDGFQTFLDRGHHIGIAPIGNAAWVEIDEPADLAQAQTIYSQLQETLCRS